MAKVQKTNAARLLDQAKIPYELIPYEVDDSDLSAPHVAESLGEDVAQVFKTLVLHGDRTAILFVSFLAMPLWTSSWQPRYQAIRSVR